MKLIFQLTSDQRAIHFIDEVMNNFVNLYQLPQGRELCFAVHELVINAVEVMKKSEKEKDTITVTIIHKNDRVIVTVLDRGMGIEEQTISKILELDSQNISFSERGRGLFFVQNMVDKLWFENQKNEFFLVGISKSLNRLQSN